MDQCAHDVKLPYFFYSSVWQIYDIDCNCVIWLAIQSRDKYQVVSFSLPNNEYDMHSWYLNITNCIANRFRKWRIISSVECSRYTAFRLASLLGTCIFITTRQIATAKYLKTLVRQMHNLQVFVKKCTHKRMTKYNVWNRNKGGTW